MPEFSGNRTASPWRTAALWHFIPSYCAPIARARAREASDDNLPFVVPGFFIDWPQRLECTRSLAETKEPGTRPMCPGDPLGNHGQRPIALALVFEPVLAHEDGMGASSPLPHQGRPGLQHYVGIERTSAFLEFSCQNLQPALQCAARAAMGAPLQLISQPPDHQIATEAQGWSSVMQCPPGTPQLLCRPIDQPRDFAIKPGQVRASQTVVSAAVCTETGGRLARLLASRSIIDWGFHRLAGSAMR